MSRAALLAFGAGAAGVRAGWEALDRKSVV
jgi:hypothetical protein